jgi:carbon monoxide dehydrogenase subunit G
MQLENKFTIDAPIEKAWVALNTPDMIAPCFPGATLTSYEGESFEGTVKVKLGPISLTYKGKGTYVDRDDANHTVTIEASGRDSRGNGTASATVTGTMTADGADRTAVTMTTDMKITGRPAQFGRGVISDVADKIITQFAGCVARKLAPEQEAVAAPAPTPAAAPAATPAPVGGGTATGLSPAAAPADATANGTASAVATATGPARPATPAAATRPVGPMKSEIDAIDLLDTAGSPVLKRLAPVAGGALLLALVVLLLRRARS